MRIRVLGPVQVEVGGQPVQLGGPKQRAVLALLALNANSTVSLDRLIDGLWGEDEPASAAKMVQLYISQLRKLLDGGDADGVEIVTHGRGYELRIDGDQVDAAQFERLVREAGAGNGTPVAGSPAADALALWRGAPLADLLDEPFAPAEARRLDELHLAALELSIEDELRAGRHLELLGRLEALVAEHPLSERLHALRMLALYRAGRQAAALEAYREARRALVDDIGVEPGPELRRMHEAILRQDRELELVVPDSSWTQRATLERVRSGAGDAAARRGELRELEADLAADVADLNELHDEGRGLSPSNGDMPVCPYRGLTPFEAADAEYFSGRERLVAEIVARLVGAGLLAVVGPSGSGKSSVLRAGLLPALARGVLPGSETWRIELMRPGEHPMAELTARLPAQAGETRLVLAVDQFEETFTQCRDADERAAFLDALVDAAQRDDHPVTAVLALRADYYGACSAHPRLARALGQSHVLVGPMQPQELARAIADPARKAGLTVEAELVDRLVDDVDQQPGALPLLSTALLELWQLRDGRVMRLSDYAASGGVDGAVARLAERGYGRLAADDRQRARRILLRLAGPGEADSLVRRRVPLSELEADCDVDVARVLGALADARLVTVDDDSAEVSHEALLREWPRLRGWLEEDAAGRRLHLQLAGATREWDAGGRDTGALLRGARLAAALEWAPDHDAELNRLEREFLDASRTLSEHEAERARRTNRRLRALLITAAAGLVIAVAAGLLAISQRGEARDAALTADAQRVGAQAITLDRPDQALLLARAGVDLDDSVATRSNLLSVLMRNPAAIGELRGDGWGMYAVAVSPDGRLAATGTFRGTVTVFDASSGRVVGKPYQLKDGLVQTLTFSPDGRSLAVTGQEPENEPPGALVDLIDPRTGARRWRSVLPEVPGRSDFVYAQVRFLPGGRDLVVRQDPIGPDGEAPAVHRRLDGATGAVDGPRRVVRAGSYALSATADSRTLFLTNEAGNFTEAIDTERLQVLRRFPVGDAAGSVSRDGRLFALGSSSGRVRLLDLRSGEVRSLRGRHQKPVSSMAFVPDGSAVVSGSEDGEVIVWDVARGELRERLRGHTDSVTLAVSADSRTLYSSGLEGRTIVWDLAGDRRLVRPFAAGGPFELENDQSPKGLAHSPDTGTLAVSQSDGTVDLIDTRTLKRRSAVRALDGFAAAVEFSPDGKLMAVTGEKGRIALRDARPPHAPRGELRGLVANSQALAFSPDGKLLAGAEQNFDTRIASGTVRLWDVQRRRATGVKFNAISPSLAFSPDNRLLAAAGFEGPTEVRDPRTGRRVAALRTTVFGRSVAFSPDGRLLATGLLDGRTQLWSTKTWKPVGRPFEGQTGRIISMQFSAGGRTLATSSGDGTVVLWEVASRRQIGAPLKLKSGSYVSAVMEPGGSRLFAVSDQGPAFVWQLDPRAWKRQACRVAGRQMTEREWRDALPERPYRAVCGGR